jgi:hypothetical protein
MVELRREKRNRRLGWFANAFKVIAVVFITIGIVGSCNFLSASSSGLSEFPPLFLMLQLIGSIVAIGIAALFAWAIGELIELFVSIEELQYESTAQSEKAAFILKRMLDEGRKLPAPIANEELLEDETR